MSGEVQGGCSGTSGVLVRERGGIGQAEVNLPIHGQCESADQFNAGVPKSFTGFSLRPHMQGRS